MGLRAMLTSACTRLAQRHGDKRAEGNKAIGDSLSFESAQLTLKSSATVYLPNSSHIHQTAVEDPRCTGRRDTQLAGWTSSDEAVSAGQKFVYDCEHVR